VRPDGETTQIAELHQADLDGYAGERGRWDKPLPRGYQRVERCGGEGVSSLSRSMNRAARAVSAASSQRVPGDTP
jgi:hypothetical protein